jgi:F-box and WD-40 domain protein CDC4
LRSTSSNHVAAITPYQDPVHGERPTYPQSYEDRLAAQAIDEQSRKAAAVRDRETLQQRGDELMSDAYDLESSRAEAQEEDEVPMMDGLEMEPESSSVALAP